MSPQIEKFFQQFSEYDTAFTGLLAFFFIVAFIFTLRTITRFLAGLILDRTRNRFLWELLVRNASLLAILTTIILLMIALPESEVLPQLSNLIFRALILLTIAMIALISVRMMLAFSRVYLRRFDMNAADNLRARKVHTQVRIIEKIAIVFILFVAVLAGALSFEGVREFGVSILASAGVLGIILGFAAQKSLSLVFAGIQIAITQPIRIDDAVIVENEWGWIEEITLTYVVVRLWDRRRLIVPINYFTETPFQNWTRNSSDLLGTVYAYLDYHMPVETIRTVVQDIVRTTPLWNGEVCVVHVTDFMANHMQLRILATANSSPETFDLRCYIREHLVNYLLKHHPEALPRVRLEPAPEFAGQEQERN